MTSSKCAYCNREMAGSKMVLNTWDGTGRRDCTFYYCSPECKTGIEEFSADLNKHVKHFLFLIILVVIAVILFPLLALLFSTTNLLVASFGIPFILLGYVLFRYPFATPGTNSNLGIKRSKRLLAFFGKTFVIIGVCMVVINLFLILS